VDAATGRGIPEVMVALTLRPAAPAGTSGSPSGPVYAPVTQRVLTGADGRFLLRDLPAGTVTISTLAAGYITGSYGGMSPNGPGSLDLADAERAGEVKIRMWKHASISGAIVDEAGDPAVGINVQLLRKSVVNGQMRYSNGRSATTDDRGWFRIGALTPGDYLVSIPNTTATMPSATLDAYFQQSSGAAAADALRTSLQSSGAPILSSGGIRVGDLSVQSSLRVAGGGPAAGEPLFAYQTIYYPAATVPGHATIITLNSGDDRAGIDLQLRPVPTFRVSGLVSGPDGLVANVGVRLLPAGMADFTTESGLEAARTATAGNGSFTFLGVAPGQYIAKVLLFPQLSPQQQQAMLDMQNAQAMLALLASSTTPEMLSSRFPAATPPSALWANAPVTVSTEDVSGLSLTLRPAPRATGRVCFDGATPPPTPDRLVAMTVALSPVGPTGAPPPPTRLTAAGEFTSAGYPPGQYYLQVPTPGAPWIAKSAMAGGRDLIQLPVELTETDVSGVVVTYTDRPSQLSGSVTALSTPSESTSVMLLAADYRSALAAGAVATRVARLVTVSKSGTYTLPALLAGEYLILAVADMDASLAMDPAFMDAIAKQATRVSLAEGEKKTMGLQAVRVQR
jgi:hypothetical protein